jgi:hypothetical protein
MMDDYEDVEQVYLAINREAFWGKPGTTYSQPRYRLVELVGEIRSMLDAGFIGVQVSLDESVAPVNKIDQTRIHEYWFGPTERGKEAWKNRP